MSQNLTVLYDGGCPLCSREINHYRRLAGDRPILWVDVARPDTALEPYGVTRQEALQRFHVFDEAGAKHTGVDAFVTLWRALPRYRLLAGAVRALHVLPLLEWAYARFAARHYLKRCREGACSLP